MKPKNPSVRDLLNAGFAHDEHLEYASTFCDEGCRGCSAELLAERVEKVLSLLEPINQDAGDTRHGLVLEILRALNGD